MTGKPDTVRVVVDRHACETHGICAALAPDVFAINDHDEMVVLDEHPHIDRLPVLNEAVAACPRVALEIEIQTSGSGDNTGGEV